MKEIPKIGNDQSHMPPGATHFLAFHSTHSFLEGSKISEISFLKVYWNPKNFMTT